MSAIPFGVIGDAFQVFGDLHDQQGPMDLPGVLHHEGQQLPEDLIVETVDGGILRRTRLASSQFSLTKASRLSRIIPRAISAIRGRSM